MILLVLGVALFAVAHLFTSYARGLRASAIKAVGGGPYKGAFALVVVGSIVLIVVGWLISDPRGVYVPPDWGRSAARALVLVGFILFASSAAKTNITRVVRHPQLTGVLVWAAAHLLANGDSHALIVFGGLGLWAIVEMGVLNRRDGAWQRPDRQAIRRELVPIAAGVVGYAVILLAHPFAFGVTP